MNEPSSFTAWGDMTLPKSTVHHLEGQGGDHNQAHNLYGLLMNRAGYEALTYHKPDKRPWLLTRSGWAGIARYAWTWTADTETSWEALRQVIPTVLGLSLTGVPYSGSDIGGFSGNPEPELYLRWFQMSAFFPFFRTHSSIESPPREPWTFDAPTLRILRDYLRLRYRMIPYIYTLSWEANQAGCPLVRPLFWNNPNNSDLWSIDDEFLLGDNLLVAPVLYQGETSRNVFLPDGQWYDFWEEKSFNGPGDFLIPVTQERLPIFVRAGSVLPFEYDNQLELNVYPNFQGDYDSNLYSDSGDGYGPSRVDTFRMHGMRNAIDLTWDETGDFPFPYTSTLLRFHHFEPLECMIDGKVAPVSDRSTIMKKFERAVIRYANKV